jgi:predicted nucleotidyltransferase
MKGGKADKLTLPQIAKKHKLPIEDLTSQFKLGVKTEMEHTDNKKQAKEIAMDHLAEDPKYYTKLKKAKLEEAINKDLLNESKLGLFINAKTNFPDADFWIIRRGSEEKVGKPVKEYNPEHIGIKVTAIDKLDPKYLYYLMEYVYSKGYYKPLVHGTLNLKNIKISDILGIDISMNESLIMEDELPSKLKTDIEIEYHKKLNSKFWLNNHLKSNIRKKLLTLAKFYFNQLDLGVELKDIVFTGSLANYNYTNLSDIDLHLVINYKDLTDDEEFAKEFFGDKRALWADSNEIKINNYPVEIYVQNESQLDDKGMGAMYSLLNNQWIKKPKYKLPNVDKHLITQKVNKYLDILNKISIMKDSKKKLQSYTKVMEKIRDDRRKSTKEEGEFSVDNLVFKVLRNKKVFDIISNNKKEIVNILFSINSN